MAKGKSPAFQFYPSDWLSSTSVALMTPAEEGGYIRLLCHEWAQSDCGLPNNDEVLAELSRLKGQWKKSGPKILKCFEIIGDRLYNPRLIEEWQKQQVWRQKSSNGGKLSATKRNHPSTTLQPPLENGCQMVDEKKQPKGNSSSSSSSSSSINPKTLNPCATEVAPPAFDQPGLIELTAPEPKYDAAWFDREHSDWYRNAYWRRVAQKDSRKAYEKRIRLLVNAGSGHQEAAEFLKRFAIKDRARFEDTPDWEWRRLLHPTTWLNGERWKDEPAERKRSKSEIQADEWATV